MENIIQYDETGFCCHLLKDIAMPLHMHNEVELLYVHSGSLKLNYGKTEYTLHKDDFALIFPNIIHAVTPLEPTDYLQSVVDKHLYMGLVEIFWWYAVEGSPIVAKNRLHYEVDFSITQLCERDHLWHNGVITKAYLTIILKNMLASLQIVELPHSARAEWLGDALSYLNDNFSQPITLDLLSKNLGISKYHLSRNFNARVGCSISAYINRLRVAKAMRRLERFDDTVVNIALACGFDSNATFFRVFKEHTGMSPKQYKETIRAMRTKRPARIEELLAQTEASSNEITNS